MTLHKQHFISNTSGLSIKPNGNYLFRFVISDKLKSFFNRFEFKKTYKQDFYVLDIIKDVEHIKTQYKHIKKVLLSNKLSKDNIQRLGISHRQIIEDLPIRGREEFLEYHRK